MLKPYLTPPKELEETTSPDNSLPLTALIFSGSTRKNQRTRGAEQRYSKNHQDFEKIEIYDYADDLKSSKLLTFNEPAMVRPKHRRKSSVDENTAPHEKNSKVLIKHFRNISDADSVIYKQTEDDLGKVCGRSCSVRGSLPILEGTPCTVYCKYCEKQVHSTVDFYNSSIPGRY